MRYDGIFFDLDGTVIDSLLDISDAVNHTMARFGLPLWTPEQLRPRLGWGVGPLMEAILPRELTEAQKAAVVAYYRPWYAAHTGDKSVPYPGVLPLMERIRALGLIQAILSNKPDAALQPLVARYFSGLVALAEGERPGVRRKPCPDMVLSAAVRLGLSPERVLYVGDSEVDIDTAVNAGVDCVCVTWGFRSREQLVAAGAKAIIDAPGELLPLILGEDRR